MDKSIEKYEKGYQGALEDLDSKLKKLDVKAFPKAGIDDLVAFFKNEICPLVTSALGLIDWVPSWVPGIGQIKELLLIIKRICDSL